LNQIYFSQIFKGIATFFCQSFRNAKVVGSILALGNPFKPSSAQVFDNFFCEKTQKNSTNGGPVGETMATRGKTSLIKKEQDC
jgi:hypothetical protein